MDGDSEFLDHDEFARGIIDAHKAGNFLLHHFYDSHAMASDRSTDGSIFSPFLKMILDGQKKF